MTESQDDQENINGDLNGELELEMDYDSWYHILSFLHKPKDFRNAALTCKLFAEIALAMKNRKAEEFLQTDVKTIHGIMTTRYTYLPNARLHGYYEKWKWMDDYCIYTKSLYSFGSYVKEITNDTEIPLQKALLHNN